MKEELESFVKSQNIKLQLNYTLDNPEDGWSQLVGYINKEMIEKYMPPPAEDTLIMCCGSGKMCKKWLQPMLLEMGYAPDHIFIF